MLTVRERLKKVLGVHNAHCVNYDEPLENSFRAYSDCLRQAKRLDRLSQVISAIDNYAEE